MSLRPPHLTGDQTELCSKCNHEKGDHYETKYAGYRNNPSLVMTDRGCIARWFSKKKRKEIGCFCNGFETRPTS